MPQVFSSAITRRKVREIIMQDRTMFYPRVERQDFSPPYRWKASLKNRALSAIQQKISTGLPGI